MDRRAVEERARWSVMSAEGRARKRREHAIRPGHAGTPGQVGRLGKLLGVDAVVAGRVDEYGLAYRFMVQSARVQAAWWCVVSQTGARCWEMEFAKSRRFAHERDLAREGIRECVEELACARRRE